MTQPATVVIRVNDAQALRALDGIARKFQSVGASIRTASAPLAALGATLTGLSGVGLKAFGGLDTKLRTIKGVTGATDAEMQRVRESLRGMSDDGSPDVLAAEMEALARAGRSAGEALDSIGAIATLRKIEPDLGVGEAAAQVDGVLSGFQLQASKAGRVVDLLAGTANASKASIQDIGTAFSVAASTAKSADQSIERLAGAVAILANNNYRGERAGTALRGVLVTLGKSAKQAKLKELLGVDALDANRNFRDLSDIFGDISAKLRSLPSGERASILSQVFDTEQIGAANILIDNVDALNRLTAEIDNADGSAAALAATMTGGLEGSGTRLKNALTSLSQTIGEALAPSVIPATDRLKELVKQTEAIVQANPQAVTALAALGSGLLVVGTAGTTAGYALEFMGNGLSTLSAAASRTAGVLSQLSVANLKSAATATVATTAYLALAAAKITAATSGLALIAAAGAIAQLGTSLVQLGATIAAVRFGKDFSEQSGVVRLLIDGLRKAVEQIATAFRVGFSVGVSALQQFARGARQAIGVAYAALDPAKAVRSALRFAEGIVEPIKRVGLNIARTVAPVLTNLAQTVAPYVVEAFRFVVDQTAPLREAFYGALQGIGSFVASALRPIYDAARSVVGRVASIAQTFAEPFIVGAQHAFAAVRDFAIGSIDFARRLGSQLASSAASLASSFGSIFGEASKNFRLVVDLVRGGKFQEAFDLGSQTAVLAMEAAFASIEAEWLKVVQVLAKGFDDFVSAILTKTADAIGAIITPLRNALGQLDQAAISAGLGDPNLSGTFTEPLRQLPDQLREAVAGITIKSAEGQAKGEEKIAAAEARAAEALAGISALFEKFATDSGPLAALGRVAETARASLETFGQGLLFGGANLGELFSGIGERAFGVIAGAEAEARGLTTAQVFSGAAIQVAGMNRDAIGDQQFAEAQRQTELLASINQRIGDLDTGLGFA